MPGGRPTKYDPAICDEIVEYGKAGKSRTWIAATLGISRQTMANWEEAQPEFLDATTRARMLAQKWWEDAGQMGMEADKFNGPVWAKNMAARFPDEWREKQLIGSDPENPMPAALSGSCGISVVLRRGARGSTFQPNEA